MMMPDRGTVISHFQDAIVASGAGNHWRFVRADIIEDAIALLREQEPVDAVRDKESYGKDDFGAWWYACGNCHGVIDYKDKFCRHCGREVKWDAAD